VEEDISRDLALALARHLVMFLRRPGNQSQFSATLATQEPVREPLREARRHIIENIDADLSVETLAGLAHMSPRNFARSFRAETGITPARYVESVRIEAARRALEDTPAPVASIAAACGFGTPETMRRSFLRALGVAPAEYRRRFYPTAAGDSPAAVA
jgi:transcriptional regulator GlxA family with amidase domain